MFFKVIEGLDRFVHENRGYFPRFLRHAICNFYERMLEAPLRKEERDRKKAGF